MTHGPSTATEESPLRIPIFRAMWVASMASNFGSLIQAVGASWTMTSLDSSAALVALVQSSTLLPIMLLSLLAGAMADSLDRRLVMLSAQIFMLITSLALAACAWSGVLTPWLLLVFTFLIGCGTALSAASWQASVGDMVPRSILPSAVALNIMAFNIARSLGPAVGGLIVATAGASAAFLANALSYLGLIGVLMKWRPVHEKRALPGESLGGAMAAGIRYVAKSSSLCIILARGAVFGVPANVLPALMPLVARDLIGAGALVYGLLLGAFGIGAVGGAVLSGRLRQRLSSERIVQLASLSLALGTAVAAISRLMPLTVPALMLAGAGWVLALSTLNVTFQLAAPRWVLGRGLALYQAAAFGAMAAGSWTFGLVAEHHGVSVALLAAASAQVASVLLVLPLPWVEGGKIDEKS